MALFFRYIIVVEHDLSVLDYLSDFICCLYGVPSAYGVVTMPFSVREGNSCCISLFKHTKKILWKEKKGTKMLVVCYVNMSSSYCSSIIKKNSGLFSSEFPFYMILKFITQLKGLNCKMPFVSC